MTEPVRAEKGILGWASRRAAQVRDRSPAADHLWRALQRFADVQGSLLAAGITYYGFLALFPLAAVAYGVLSVLVLLMPALETGVKDLLPPELAATIDLSQLAAAGVTAGLIGLGVMIYAGVRLVAALRRALTVVFGGSPREVPFVRGVVRDLLTLVALGLCLLAAVAATALTTVVGSFIDRLLGPGTTLDVWLVRLLALLVSLVTLWAMFTAIYGLLPSPRPGRRVAMRGALLGAVGGQVITQVGAMIIASASRNVVYGTFTITVGLLAWIAYASRWVLLAGSWTATADRSVPAEGSAGPGVATAQVPAVDGGVADQPQAREQDDGAGPARPRADG